MHPWGCFWGHSAWVLGETSSKSNGPNSIWKGALTHSQRHNYHLSFQREADNHYIHAQVTTMCVNPHRGKDIQFERSQGPHFVSSVTPPYTSYTSTPRKVEHNVQVGCTKPLLLHYRLKSSEKKNFTPLNTWIIPRESFRLDYHALWRICKILSQELGKQGKPQDEACISTFSYEQVRYIPREHQVRNFESITKMNPNQPFRQNGVNEKPKSILHKLRVPSLKLPTHWLVEYNSAGATHGP